MIFFPFLVASLAKTEFVEITGEEVIFYNSIPLKWRNHPAIRGHIEGNAGFGIKVFRIPMYNIEETIHPG